ncbi:MAG: hypothetical protein AB7S26_26795 [Sandaracinaceae bacterium]
MATVAALVLASACSVGNGEGAVTGAVVAPDCDIDVSDYDLHPTFFSGEVTEEQMNIRVQRGSDIEGFADGVMIHVLDVNEVFRSRIGLPIEITDEYGTLIQMELYLNETCPSGFPDDFRVTPLILQAVGGEITFRSIYAPDIEPGAAETSASFDAVELRDRDDPARSATIDGTFSFFYQRGSPAQRFP